jgi:SAM-dependent methyltransferase
MALLPDLTQRRRRPELMDEPHLDARRHLHALSGLARINFVSGSARTLWPAVHRLARTSTRSLRLLDLASGGGDVSIALARKAARVGVALDVEGWDRSPLAVEHARARGVVPGGLCVRFAVYDVLSDPLPDDRDVICCSLFLHHLDEPAAIAFLQRIGQAARKLVLVNDLARGRSGLLLAHIATRVLTLSSVVHIDGPRSVEGAFTPEEACRLAEEAGLHGATVRRCWPCRYLLAWSRP